MKTAMFVLAIIELVFIFYSFILHNIMIDINDWSMFNTIQEYFVLFVMAGVSIALSVLCIIFKFL